MDYLGSARYDDVLDIFVRVAKLGRSSVTFLFEVWRAEPDPSERPLITAELVYVNADPETMTSAPLPAEVRELIEKFEHTPLQ